MSWWELRVTDASREVQLLQEGREVKYTSCRSWWDCCGRLCDLHGISGCGTTVNWVHGMDHLFYHFVNVTFFLIGLIISHQPIECDLCFQKQRWAMLIILRTWSWRVWLLWSSLEGDTEIGVGDDDVVMVQVTPCDHFFHTGCLQRWMDIKMECPTCRRPLPPM
jgi:hypothetical protein